MKDEALTDAQQDRETCAGLLIAAVRARGHTLVLRGRHPHLSGSAFRALTPAEKECWKRNYSVVRDLLLREAEGPPGVAVSPTDEAPAPKNTVAPPAQSVQPDPVRQAVSPGSSQNDITAPVHEKAERHAREATAVMWKQIVGRTYE